MLGDTPAFAIWIPVIVAVIAPLFAYVAAARRMSGKIGTSEAKDLWAESKSLRADALARESAAAIRVVRLEEKIDHLEAIIVQLRETIQRLEIIVLEQRIALREAGADDPSS